MSSSIETKISFFFPESISRFLTYKHLSIYLIIDESNFFQFLFKFIKTMIIKWYKRSNHCVYCWVRLVCLIDFVKLEHFKIQFINFIVLNFKLNEILKFVYTLALLVIVQWWCHWQSNLKLNFLPFRLSLWNKLIMRFQI